MRWLADLMQLWLDGAESYYGFWSHSLLDPKDEELPVAEHVFNAMMTMPFM